MVDQLANDYKTAGKNVLMLEYDVDGKDTPARKTRWFTAFGGGSATLPLISVDSGFRITQGSVDFGKIYKRMIDEALRRKPGVELEAAYKIVGSDVAVTMRITNRSGMALSSANGTTLNALIWLEKKILHTGRTLVAEQINGICKPLMDGQTATCVVTMKGKAGQIGAQGQVLALVDYRPGNTTGPYESLNAAHAIKGELPPLVDPPTATPEPPTDVPEPTATEPPVVIDMPPTVKSPIADISVMVDEPVASIDLSKVFTDSDSDPALMTFELETNSNPTLVQPVITGTMLDLPVAAGQTGVAMITIRATSNGKKVHDSFTLTVTGRDPVEPTIFKLALPWLESNAN